MPPWRNRLARSAVNRKVGGSSPPGGANLFASGLFVFSRLRPLALSQIVSEVAFYVHGVIWLENLEAELFALNFDNLSRAAFKKGS